MLTRDRIKPASLGEPNLLIFSVPSTIALAGEGIEVYALPIQMRRGGFLLAVPDNVLSPQSLQSGQEDENELAMIGPNSVFQVPMFEEADDLSVIELGIVGDVVVVDMTDEVLSLCREYDPVTDSLLTIGGFSDVHPNALPDCNVLFDKVKEWISARSDERSGFYTAQEDREEPAAKPAPHASPKKATPKVRVTNSMIAEQLSTLAAQMQVLTQRQDRLEKSKSSSAENVGGRDPGILPNAQSQKLPAVSAGLPNPSGISQIAAKALSLTGPPPKTMRNVPQAGPPDLTQMDDPLDPLQARPEEPMAIVSALAQQSTAITALVAHLASQAPDALGDLASLGHSTSSTKGVQKRERMQNDLATGQSMYFVQMMQQLHQRLHPAKPVPQTEEELCHLSVLTYLERQGGYRQHRELGLIAWILGHAIDAAAMGDLRRTKEIMALMMVSVEQAAVDKGDWSLAYLLTLLEDPPLQMFQERSATLGQHSKVFGPLVPPNWTAVCLAYLKDMEVLASKRNETAKKPAKAMPSSSSVDPGGNAEPDREASPKRKPRFPRKPKAKASAEA